LNPPEIKGESMKTKTLVQGPRKRGNGKPVLPLSRVRARIHKSSLMNIQNRLKSLKLCGHANTE
jgi:hypothetical protein